PVAREASRAALEPAGERGVTEIPAPVALEQVPADGAHRSQLQRRRVAQCLADDGVDPRELIALLEVDESRERADAQAGAALARPALEAVEAGQVDEELGLRDPTLHQAEEVRPA